MIRFGSIAIALSIFALSFQPATLGAQQAQPAPKAGHMHSMKPKGHMMMGRMNGKGHARQSNGPGDRKGSLADKLNGCQMRDQAERQPCMDHAIHP